MKMLEDLGISNAQQRMKQYPHQLSGGVCQRVLIAMALICNPEFLIADEPTTALAVNEVERVLNFVREVKAEGRSAIIITHSIDHAWNLADRFVILSHGKVFGEWNKNELTLDSLFKKLREASL